MAKLSPTCLMLTVGAAALALSACTPASINNAASPPTPPSSAPAAPQVTAANQGLAEFLDKLDLAQLSTDPLSKTMRGIRDADDGKWPDPSDEAAVARHALQQAAADAAVRTFAPDQLNENDRLTLQLFTSEAARTDRLFPFRNHDYIFEQMNGIQAQAPAFLINMHSVSNLATAQSYISRLAGLADLLDQLSAQSAQRAAAGIAPPKWVYAYVLSDIDNLNRPDNAILQDFTAKVNALSLPAAQKSQLLAQAKAAWDEKTSPAYTRLRAEMVRQQASASTDDGIWRLPDGPSYYAALLASYTSTNMSAADIHALGRAEVARIHTEMEAIKNKVGFTGSLSEFFTHLRDDPKYYHNSREAYLADVDRFTRAMETKLPEYFHSLPKAPLVVKPVEAFREKSAGKAFYSSPSPDGSRPGTYYVNLYNLRDMSKTELEALAYHEGVPGHHLQRAIQTELTDLPAFRRFGGFTAYTEGWGLYSEQLGKDMGFYTDPYSDFGRLAMELWRACRLVVDTGIHDQKWTREQAIAYLKQTTPNPDGDIEKAVERYIVFPGQATAYTIGKIKIVQLRRYAEQALGDKFDIRDFHESILRSGPVTLDILDDRVKQWVSAQK
ncbi:DUF885 domain-containing protein [Sphingopyxis yananensis]|uniref:DUF885 domain-containing protein n=1 Tax=Sphingopyxis yananensis TaxID=2886687 RepID=UPI001D0FA2FA|nr:DUF885 domain-containing protein [Sphingopyxis yananensis]MCC2602091.1 DUF885 domain-containing protein [Sphingopyxis yananensis]